jgi:hypothetical protein
LRAAVEVIQNGHNESLVWPALRVLMWRVANPGSPAPARKLVLRAGSAAVWIVRKSHKTDAQRRAIGPVRARNGWRAMSTDVAEKGIPSKQVDVRGIPLHEMHGAAPMAETSAVRRVLGEPVVARSAPTFNSTI